MEIPYYETDLGSPFVQRNPYPFYAEMRNHYPICRLTDGQVAITRSEDVIFALKNPSIFSSKGIKIVSEAAWIEPECQRSMYILSQDAELHASHRSLVNREFVGDSIKKLIPFMRSETERFLDGIGSGSFEFVELFAYPYIRSIIGRLIVADDIQTSDQIRQAIHVREKSTPFDPPEDFKASYHAVMEEQNDYLKNLIAERRKCPKDDVTTRLLNIRPNNAALSDYELKSALDLFLSAGFHTTAQVLASAMLYLSNLDDVFSLLKAQPDRIPDFIEELLRIDGPTHRLLRTVVSPVELNGHSLQPGEVCSVIVASANHDPALFPDPDKFDIDRQNKKRHLEFGYGDHVCIGSLLARTEIRVALEVILERYKKVECRIQHDVEWVSTVTTRGIRALNVQLS